MTNRQQRLYLGVIDNCLLTLFPSLNSNYTIQRLVDSILEHNDELSLLQLSFLTIFKKTPLLTQRLIITYDNASTTCVSYVLPKHIDAAKQKCPISNNKPLFIMRVINGDTNHMTNCYSNCGFPYRALADMLSRAMATPKLVLLLIKLLFLNQDSNIYTYSFLKNNTNQPKYINRGILIYIDKYIPVRTIHLTHDLQVIVANQKNRTYIQYLLSLGFIVVTNDLNSFHFMTNPAVSFIGIHRYKRFQNKKISGFHVFNVVDINHAFSLITNHYKVSDYCSDTLRDLVSSHHVGYTTNRQPPSARALPI